MTPGQFNELLEKDPFIPIRLHLNSGDVVEITNPGSVQIHGATLYLFTVRRDASHIVDWYRYIPLRNVAQIEQVAAA
jgi:hypothetical protein